MVTFRCLLRDAMPVSARKVNLAPILATIQSWPVACDAMGNVCGLSVSTRWTTTDQQHLASAPIACVDIGRRLNALDLVPSMSFRLSPI